MEGLNDEPLENNPSVAFADALFFHSLSSRRCFSLISSLSLVRSIQLPPSLPLTHAHAFVELDRWLGRVFVSRLAPTIVALPEQNDSTIGPLKKRKAARGSSSAIGGGKGSWWFRKS